MLGTAKIALAITEVAELLGLHPNTVRRAVWRGHIKAVRIGRRVLVPRAEVERLLNLAHDGEAGQGRAG